MKIRRLNRILHRDIGYLCAGLTIIYAISGLAVNHTRDWNPNYKIEKPVSDLGPIPVNSMTTDELIRYVLEKLGLPETYTSSFYPDDHTLQIFLPANTVTVDLQTGRTVQEKVSKRTFLWMVNFLHLNVPKKLWTYVADIYAVALLIVTITGLFVIKGKNGITGRGAWLTALGVLIPLLFLFIYL